jgi:nicotinamide mononucleotide transporter
VFHQALYADVLQQLVYFTLLVAGWIQWRRAGSDAPVRVTTLDMHEAGTLAVVWVAGSALMGYLFANYSNAAYPWWDSGATVLCFIAQWLIARRKIENWILWMAANPVYITLYVLKGLEWYAALALIYFIMAVLGWRQWRGYLLEQRHAA